MVEIQIRKPVQENDTPPPSKRIKTNWRRKTPYSKFKSTIAVSSEDMHDKALFESNLGNKSPMEIFEILTEGLFQLMETESNRYAGQKNKEICTTKDDYMTFCAILLLSGYHTVPRQHQYWSNEPDLGCDLVKRSMTKNRFCSLKQYLHFNNNDAIPQNCNDPLYKLRPLLDLLN